MKKICYNIYMGYDNIRIFAENSNAIESIIDSEQTKYTVKAWNYLIDKKNITIKDILKIHKIIMQPLRPNIAGKLRNVNVRVTNSTHICPEWREVPDLLNKWIEHYGKGPQIVTHRDAGEEELLRDTINACRIAHISYEHLHPFQDGNGRTGRLLMLWHRYIAKLPFEYIKFTERYDYYGWF